MMTIIFCSPEQALVRGISSELVQKEGDIL